jgi:hypothetical protein
MKGKTIYQHMKEQIDRNIQSNTSFISRGMTDHGEYMRHVGILQGLQAMRAMVVDLERMTATGEVEE